MDDPRIEMKLDDMLFTVLQEDFDNVLDDIPDSVPVQKPVEAGAGQEDGDRDGTASRVKDAPSPPGEPDEADQDDQVDEPVNQEPAFSIMRRMFREFHDHHSWLLSSRTRFGSMSVKERVNYLLDEASRLDVFLRRFNEEARALNDMDLPSPSSALYVNMVKRYDTLKKQLVLEEQKLRRNLDSLARKMKDEVDSLVQSGGSLVQNGDEVIKAESPLLNGITVNQALVNLQAFLKNYIYLLTFGELPGRDDKPVQDNSTAYKVPKESAKQMGFTFEEEEM